MSSSLLKSASLLHLLDLLVALRIQMYKFDVLVLLEALYKEPELGLNQSHPVHVLLLDCGACYQYYEMSEMSKMV